MNTFIQCLLCLLRQENYETMRKLVKDLQSMVETIAQGKEIITQ